MFVEFPGIRRTEERVIDVGNFLDATDRALELESDAFCEFPPPASFGFFRQDVEPPRNIGCGRFCLLRIAKDARIEHAENGRLFDNLASIAAVQSLQDGAYDARLLD